MSDILKYEFGSIVCDRLLRWRCETSRSSLDAITASGESVLRQQNQCSICLSTLKALAVQIKLQRLGQAYRKPWRSKSSFRGSAGAHRAHMTPQDSLGLRNALIGTEEAPGNARELQEAPGSARKRRITPGGDNKKPQEPRGTPWSASKRQ